MSQEKRTTTDAVEILHHLYIKDDPERLASLEAERVKSKIARQIYDLRHQAGLTQQELAARAGTTAAVIDNLEETDYEDHQLGDAVLMLQRIAKALDKQMEFAIVPQKAKTGTPLLPQPAF
jgi:ribosome-binding protein aMBF1 (putative translation factor)